MQHGDICLSTGSTTITSGFSEDCLFVDVYAPTKARQGSDTPLPVYVYIQSGGFNSNSNANYNGSGLIRASDLNIVVVTFNYRVGPTGSWPAKKSRQMETLITGCKIRENRLSGCKNTLRR